jgi:two-component system CheB/CheR fusion protein
MAWVVVQHLNPRHESMLVELLARATPMPVKEARHNLKLEPNCGYVMRPNTVLGLSEGRLKVSPRRDHEGRHMPIDHFLESLAAERGNGAMGVILSGAGSDGTHGLSAIKAAGGITFAQDEKTARFSAMPTHAVAAGCVDFVLPPERIAHELVRIADHPYVAARDCRESKHDSSDAESLFQEICALLQQDTGASFTQYKRAILQRRIRRRMALHRMESLRDYVDFLYAHPAEVQQLFDDVSIHVSRFFPDRRVFEVLKKEVWPRLLNHRPAGQPIRLWVPGCSTGEEAYSIAITLFEFLATNPLRYPVQVFATDTNSAVLAKARSGLFPSGISRDVSPDRLARFFTKTQSGYRMAKSIRDSCVFARRT